MMKVFAFVFILWAIASILLPIVLMAYGLVDAIRRDK